MPGTKTAGQCLLQPPCERAAFITKPLMMSVFTVVRTSVCAAGALELRNYPTALLNLRIPKAGAARVNSSRAADTDVQRGADQSSSGRSGQAGREMLLDMGAVDVWRSREARVPLFNDFLKVRQQSGWGLGCTVNKQMK